MLKLLQQFSHIMFPNYLIILFTINDLNIYRYHNYIKNHQLK
jgi:hypothetical protein